ncbi:MAG: DUF2149 domain-containing protein [Pseudomonadota bacterium]
MNLLEDESNNPILSVVNIVDVFLVIIAALLIAIANNPFSPYNTENVVVVKNVRKIWKSLSKKVMKLRNIRRCSGGHVCFAMQEWKLAICFVV